MRAAHVLAQKRKIPVAYLDFSSFIFLFLLTIQTVENIIKPWDFSLWQRDV